MLLKKLLVSWSKDSGCQLWIKLQTLPADEPAQVEEQCHTANREREHSIQIGNDFTF